MGTTSSAPAYYPPATTARQVPPAGPAPPACGSAPSTCALKEGACARPYLALDGAPRFQGGCRSNWQSGPVIRSAVNVDTRAPVVSLGFARYIPYTQISSIAGGSWQFVPVFGQLVVAMPASQPACDAQEIAKSPASWGYTLYGTTYMPAYLGPGDQALLAGL